MGKKDESNQEPNVNGEAASKAPGHMHATLVAASIEVMLEEMLREVTLWLWVCTNCKLERHSKELMGKGICLNGVSAKFRGW